VDHSAAYDAGRVAGAIIGYLLVYGGVIALGVFFGKRLARKRDIGFVRWPLALALMLVLLLLAGQCAKYGQAPGVASGVEA
jgi:predicted MFS family arabinose efflux permease